MHDTVGNVASRRQDALGIVGGVSTRDELLVTMADADAAHRPEREQFFMIETFGGVTVGHPALPDGEIKVNKPDVLDLIDLGYLRPTHGSNILFLDVTDAGLQEATQLRLSGAMHQAEPPPPVTVILSARPVFTRIQSDTPAVEDVPTPPDIQTERERLTGIATDFGWRFGFAQEPDGSWFWLVMDVETDEPIKSGASPSWQDALIDCLKDLVPPNLGD
jgi:hypothetical protein